MKFSQTISIPPGPRGWFGTGISIWADGGS